jgi:predicted transcriptional regulator
MGTSQPAVARLEAGNVDVRLSTLERYAAAVGGRLRLRLDHRDRER